MLETTLTTLATVSANYAGEQYVPKSTQKTFSNAPTGSYVLVAICVEEQIEMQATSTEEESIKDEAVSEDSDKKDEAPEETTDESKEP